MVLLIKKNFGLFLSFRDAHGHIYGWYDAWVGGRRWEVMHETT